ncbi:hypothetical protein [Rhizobium laguerreae]|uniref:hypothetical protein n=1 Tax=Rhizobium laguerreae TaxID=1076926 RepID=UPI001C9183A9|nr:hypothetical protein [Rhizobium laguerreae]MBY3117311.1 hypothetical protein [Rhizobium laguerreae]MBY3441765.1 hypothetical protein [Rhizobium laguerreae]
MSNFLTPLFTALATAVASIMGAWLLARTRSGRLARTLDFSTRILNFIEQSSARYDGLTKVPEEKRTDLEKLISDSVKAVQEDFSIERSLLLEFQQTNHGIHNAFLFRTPKRTILYPLYLLFYTALLFMVYVPIIRYFNGQPLVTGDVVAVLVSGLIALLIRGIVSLIPS